MPLGPRNSAGLIPWWDQISSLIPSGEDVSQAASLVPGLPGMPDPKNISRAIDTASQVFRPIGAFAGAAGNLFSEAKLEENRSRARAERYGTPMPKKQDIPSAFDAAMTEQATSPLEARKAINVLDAAAVGAGTGAGLLAKAAPAVARVLGAADVGLSALDASFGGANIATGVKEGDPAKVAMGVARTAGNIYGGKKAVDQLRELGVKLSPEFDRPQRWITNDYGDRVPLTDPETGFTPGKEAKFTTKARTRSETTGNEYTFETRTPAADRAAAKIDKSPEAKAAFTDLGDFIDSVAVNGSEELVGRIGTSREAASLDPSMVDIYGETGNFRGFSLGGDEYGHTYISDRTSTAARGAAFYVNPFNIARAAKEGASWLLEKAVDPVLLARAADELPDPMKAYIAEVRTGGTRVPELDEKLELELFRRRLVYTALHESLGHTIKDTGHAGGGRAPEYKTKTYAQRGELFEGDPRQIHLGEGLEQTGFEPAHNAVTTALKDPAQLAQLKAMMEGPAFQARLKEWYMASKGDALGLRDAVAKRTDRVVGRAEAKQAVFDEPGEPPTPPGDVPPGSSGGDPQGPQLPPLSKRIEMAFRDQEKVSEIANTTRGTIRSHQADAIRELEDKFNSRQISLDDFEAERARVMSGTMGLENRVNAMAITPEEKFEMIQRIRAEGGDDAFLRNRLHDSFNKLTEGKRLQDAELKDLRDFLVLKTNDMKMSGQEKVESFFDEAAGGVRALRTSWDLSAWRQGLFAMPMNPTASAKAIKAQFKSLFMSPDEFEVFMKRLQDMDVNPYAKIAKAAGLHFSETMEKGTRLTTEEAFSSGKWAQVVPGVKRSEQAYIAFLNKLRTEVFNKHIMQLTDSGVPIFDADGGVTQLVKDIAYSVNTLTGRGELSFVHMSPDAPAMRAVGWDKTFAPGKKKFDQMHTALTTAFFAPRFQASRFAMMRDASLALIGGNLNPAAYKMYMKNMFGTIAAITSAMVALSGAGVGTFESDPRKKDFGVIKVGKVRYDGYGSLKQWARLFAQMSTDRLVDHPRGQRHMTGEKQRILYQFARGKASPLMSVAISAITGEDFLGRPVEYGQLARSVAMPMIFETAYEVIKEGEAEQLGAAIPASVFGVGVNAYDERQQDRRPSRPRRQR